MEMRFQAKNGNAIGATNAFSNQNENAIFEPNAFPDHNGIALGATDACPHQNENAIVAPRAFPDHNGKRAWGAKMKMEMQLVGAEMHFRTKK